MSTAIELLDLGMDDTNNEWCKCRAVIEEQARELRWWEGIWDDTPKIYGVPTEALLGISKLLHAAWNNVAHSPLKEEADKIVLAHIDEEFRNGR